MSVGFKIDYVDLNQIEKQLGITPKDVQKDENVNKLKSISKLINKIFKNFSKLFSDKKIKNRIIEGLSKELHQVNKVLNKEIKPGRSFTLESAEIEKNLFKAILDRSIRIEKILREISDPKNENFEILNKNLSSLSDTIKEFIKKDEESINALKPKYEEVMEMGKELDKELEKVSGLKLPIELETVELMQIKNDRIGNKLNNFDKPKSKRFDDLFNSIYDKYLKFGKKIKEAINALRPKYELMKMGEELDKELEIVSGLKQPIELETAKLMLIKRDKIGKKLNNFDKPKDKRFDDLSTSIDDKYLKLGNKIKDSLKSGVDSLKAKNKNLEKEIEELNKTMYETTENLKNHNLVEKYKNNENFSNFIKETIETCKAFKKEVRENEFNKSIKEWNNENKPLKSILSDMSKMVDVKYSSPLFELNLSNAKEFINDIEKLTVEYKQNFLKKADKKQLDMKQIISDNKGKISEREKILIKISSQP